MGVIRKGLPAGGEHLFFKKLVNMKTTKFLNTAFLIPVIILILGITAIIFWRKDVEYKRCWDLLNISNDLKSLENTNCVSILKNNLLK